jgi:hypothetical protein
LVTAHPSAACPSSGSECSWTNMFDLVVRVREWFQHHTRAQANKVSTRHWQPCQELAEGRCFQSRLPLLLHKCLTHSTLQFGCGNERVKSKRTLFCSSQHLDFIEAASRTCLLVCPPSKKRSKNVCVRPLWTIQKQSQVARAGAVSNQFRLTRP